MAKEYSEKNHVHETSIWLTSILIVAVVLLFIIACVYRTELNGLRNEVDTLNGNKEIFNFNVECKGNGVMASANYSMNDRELYNKMIKVYDTKNCKISDVLLGADE